MAQYKVQFGENVYILANKLYGSVDYVGKLVIDNSITDINADLTGTLIEYDENIKSEVVDTLTLKAKVQENTTLTYRAGENQSIFDICLFTIGDLEQIVSFVKNSTIDNLSSETQGQTFTYSKNKNPLVQYASRNNLKFATGIELENRRRGSYNSAFDQQAYL